MADDGTVWIWTTAILAVSVGFAAGFLVAYLAVLRDKDASGLREELARQKEEFDAYRARVDEHFVKTSGLFQDMTRQYGALYEHMANGAQSLCSDRLVTHHPSVPESMPMVEHKPGTGTDTAAAEAAKPGPAAATAAPRPQPEPITSEAQAHSMPKQQPEPIPEPEAQASAAQETARETPPRTAPGDMDESELESFAPRPEAAKLRDSSAAEQDTAAPTPTAEVKPRLH